MLNTLCNSQNRQCYITWKSNNMIHSVFPSNSRPLTNEPTQANNIPRISFKPNPIKHWRKQLFPQQGKSFSKVGVDQAIYNPGGVVTLVNNTSYSNNCNIIKNYIHNNSETCIKNCNREVRIRSASTNIDKKYYTTSGAYLRNRVKTYNQNLPSKNLPEHNSGSASDYCNNLSGCYNKVIYKPNNTRFSQQGAVSNDLRILDIKKRQFNLTKEIYRGQTRAPNNAKSKFSPTCNVTNNNTVYKSVGGIGHLTIC